MKTLADIFVHTLKDVYYAENAKKWFGLSEQFRAFC